MQNWNIQQYDSGISSSSDGEFTSLEEREMRLNSLKQLARKLETVLAPNNAALTCINRTLDETQQEIIILHRQLQQLPQIPVKALFTNTRIPSPSVKDVSVQTDPLLVSTRKKKQRHVIDTVTANAYQDSATLYWMRLIAKAVLTILLALFALFVANWFMEPFFCLYFDSLGSSLIIQMNYFDGPPPV